MFLRLKNIVARHRINSTKNGVLLSDFIKVSKRFITKQVNDASFNNRCKCHHYQTAFITQIKQDWFKPLLKNCLIENLIGKNIKKITHTKK